MQFDGSQNYATVPNDASFFPETGTVEFWMKGPAGQSSPALLYGWGNPDYGWAFCSDGSQITLYFATAGGIQGLTTTQTPFDGTWHHVAAVWSAGTVSIFVDGTLNATTGYTGTPLVSSTALFFATAYNQSLHFSGSLDEVRISDTARYTDSFKPDCSLGTDENTVGYWKFDEGTGTTLVDASGHGHDGSLQGAPAPTWVNGVTCGGGSMNMVSGGGGAMLMGRGTSGALQITSNQLLRAAVTVTNSPVNGSSITITDTLGRVWGLLSHP